MFFLLFLLEVIDYIDDDYEMISRGAIKIIKPSLNTNCDAPHTYRNGEGKCVCDEDYPSGNASLSLGCFKCTSKCPNFSSCVYPGRCQCNPGYQGDAKACKIEKPVFKSFDPESAQAYSTILGIVNYTLSRKANFDKMYLKYRNKSIVCNPTNRSLFNCLIKNVGKSGVVELGISFDNETWSNELVEFIVYPRSYLEPILYALLVTIIVCVTVGIIKKQKKGKTLGSEIRPLLGVHQ